MRNRRHVQHPRRVVFEIAIQLPGNYRFERAEDLLQLRRPHHVGAGRNAPHQLGKFVEGGEHHSQVAWKRLRGRGAPKLPGAEPSSTMALYPSGCDGGGREHRPAAHRVSFEADVVRIHRIETAQISQRIGPAETVAERRWARQSVPALIERENDITAPRELDREAALRFTRIDVAVHGENAGRLVLRIDAVGGIEKGAQALPVGTRKTHALHAHAAADGLYLVCGEGAEKNQQQTDADQRVVHAHARVTLGVDHWRCTTLAHGFARLITTVGKRADKNLGVRQRNLRVGVAVCALAACRHRFPDR